MVPCGGRVNRPLRERYCCNTHGNAPMESVLSSDEDKLKIADHGGASRLLAGAEGLEEGFVAADV